jgi:DUF4097 and DUF4098 domain-containing protein YvlB
MKHPRLLLTVLAAALATSPAFARIERTVEKSFSVQPGGTLTVSTHGGNITVSPGAGSEVTVTARQVFGRAKTEAEADRLAAELELTIEQQGNNVQASARSPRKARFSWGGQQQVSVHFMVTVPREFDVNLRTSGGNIEVGDLQGTAEVRTSGGNLRLGRIQGPVKAATSGGNVTVVEALERLEASTSGGNIQVDRATGSTRLRTSGGSITVAHASGALDASTSGGNVRATVDGPMHGPVALNTSGGSVELQVLAGAAFRLDASTSGGRVRADGLTITLDSSGARRDRISGVVNGGGPDVRLRSSGGNVTVKLL